ncbi:hypothetical protein N431DRAFT_549664 [Stipitochalara longipes BDJ]|nr:hypothetical protein N431DRAFT_549664 [Stipitochalara longipes BDJ]
MSASQLHFVHRYRGTASSYAMIVTQRNDNARTGLNSNETILTQANVSSGNFGKIFERVVDGSVYAQPLIVKNVSLPGQSGPLDVLYVATMHNSVYCFDATHDGANVPLWKQNLGLSIQLPDSDVGGLGYKDIAWEIGILSTPVIDTASNSIYVESTSRDPSQGGKVIHTLWKLGLDGTKRGSVQINATSNGIQFASNRQNQRPALTLASGTVYLAFASYGDTRDYQGWILGYSADTLTLKYNFITAPCYKSGDFGAGIWQAGNGIATDDQGNLYCMTGNGVDTGDWSESVLKLNSGLDKVVSFFTPSNKSNLNSNDADFGSSGVVLIPGTNFVVGGGKAAILYLMDRSNLGGFNATQNQVLAFVDVASGDDPNKSHHIHGAPAYYSGPKGPRLFVWPENSFPKAISFDGSSPNLTVVSIGSTGMPGGLLSVSSNGNSDGTGILWANHPYIGDANQDIRSGVLRAFDPYDLSKELYHSRQNSLRDDFGNVAKFCCPNISGGRVYQATMGGVQNKQQLTSPTDATKVTPAFANRNDTSLAVAFIATTGEINVNSSPNGLIWDDKTRYVIPVERSNLSPGLAFSPDGATYLSWVDPDSNINIMQSTSTALNTWTTKNRTLAQSNTGVSLAFSNGMLIVAWTSNDNTLSINIATTIDGGASWKTKVTVPDTSSKNKPALVMHGSTLVLAWTGTDEFTRVNVATISDLNLLKIDTRVAIPAAQANLGPALDYDSDGVPWVVWNDIDADHRINSMTSESTDITGFNDQKTRVRRFQDDTSSSGPAFCRFKGRMIMGWGGDTGVNNQLSYAVVTRGSVAVYGLLNRSNNTLQNGEL